MSQNAHPAGRNGQDAVVAWWRDGVVSEQRDMTLVRRLIERVRRCAAHHPLLCCTDRLCSSIRAIREIFREPVQTGKGGRPRLRPWRNILIAHVVKRYARRRVVETERRIVDGSPLSAFPTRPSRRPRTGKPLGLQPTPS